MNVQKHCWGQGVSFYLFVSFFCVLILSPSALFAGSIVGWGFNGSGQATPPDGNNFIAITAGGLHSLALKFDGSIVAWGENDYGQATPPDGNGFAAIAVGGYHSLALRRVCQFNLTGDMNTDCRVDMADFAILAGNWLVDCYADPNNPSCVPK